MSSQRHQELARLLVRELPESNIAKMGLKYATSFFKYLDHSRTETIFTRESGDKMVAAAVLSKSPKTLHWRLLVCTPLILYFPRLFGRKTGPSVSKKRAMGLAKTSYPNNIPELIQIFTAASERGKKHGKELLDSCEAYLKSGSHSSYLVKTENAEGNRALSFYQKNGFSIVGELESNGTPFVLFKKDL